MIFLIFFLTLQDGKILYLHQTKNMDTSFKDWYCKLGTSQRVVNCLYYTLKYAILKLNCGVWSLCQANLLAFLHGVSSSRKESVDMKQERNLWKLFATFLLCLWTSIKLLKRNLYFSLLCCWVNSCDDDTEFFLFVSALQPNSSCLHLSDLQWFHEQERKLPVSVKYSFREKLRAFS